MKREHPEAYPANGSSRITAVRLRDQLTSRARTILLVLMAASFLVLIIACSNVANLILARSVRREAELGIRAALGAGSGALRRTLLAESLLLCVAGATLGVVIAGPMLAVLARYMSRFSLRALDLTIDSSMRWVGAGLAVAAAALLAFVPRLPSSGGSQGFALSSGSTHVTGAANRKLQILVRSDRRFLCADCVGRYKREDTRFARIRADWVRYTTCTCSGRARAAFGKNAQPVGGLLPGSDAANPFDQEQAVGGGRLFVHVRSDPYAMVMPITHIIRKISADQPVERAATLEDVRAEVLSTDRLNAVVFGVFAGVAMLIAVVGVAGVLAFSVSGRTREFGIRLAVGSQPRHLLMRVITEGVAMAILGLAAGVACGFALAQLAQSLLSDLKTPDVLPVTGAAGILMLAAVIASVIPAARAARVDVIQARRTE